MATPIGILHKKSGMMKTGYYGFSWTFLFFGFCVPLFRGEMIPALVHFAAGIITFGLWQLVGAFIYNKQYMTRMLTDGWVLAGSDDEVQRAKCELQILKPYDD